jgi:hypothetical protein
MLVTAGGARYRALVLPSLNAIDAALAEKLLSHATAGLPVLFAGKIPSHADGFLDMASETKRLEAAIQSIQGTRTFSFCPDIECVRSALITKVHPNIRFHGEAVPFIQKRIGRLNAYFLRNETDATRHIDAEFEAAGTAELWDPWTGETATIAGTRRDGDWVAIELYLQPLSSALIIFDSEGSSPAAVVASKAPSMKRTEAIGAAGWKLVATGLVPSGKTETIKRELPALIDWSLDSELRGFSGRGVYSTTFASPNANSGGRTVLDLGNVRDVAEVKVNGKTVATLLLRPYRTDITDFVRPGENVLEITVTNALFNCMVLRDPRPFHPGSAENPSGLLSAGLIGPVQLRITD